MYKRNLTFFLVRYFYFSISLHSSVEFCSTLFLFSFFTTLHNTAHHQYSSPLVEFVGTRRDQWNFIVSYTALQHTGVQYCTPSTTYNTTLLYTHKVQNVRREQATLPSAQGRRKVCKSGGTCSNSWSVKGKGFTPIPGKSGGRLNHRFPNIPTALRFGLESLYLACLRGSLFLCRVLQSHCVL